MAAEIKQVDRTKSNEGEGIINRLDLISKIEYQTFDINMAAFLINGDNIGVISVSEDKSIRIWLKRDGGKYWPSVCLFVPAPASCLFYVEETRRLFVGLSNGTIMDFIVSEDSNKLTHTKDYLVHIDRITCMHYSNFNHWIMSGSRDKNFHWYSTLTGKRIGSFFVGNWITSLYFDISSQCVFIGDVLGQITVLKITDNSQNLITVLKGHSAAVKSLTWDGQKSLLFSAGLDNIVIIWDIGSQKGIALELSGHRDGVESIKFIPKYNCLVSSGLDTNVIFWSMDVERLETPLWSESSACQCCDVPFFWNFKMMWENKTVGGRQHHCRKCGKATCSKCSDNYSTLPLYGYEYPVRICKLCHQSLTTEEQSSKTAIFQSKHKVTHIDISIQKKLLLTVGKDKVIKIWDIVEGTLVNKTKINSIT